MRCTIGKQEQSNCVIHYLSAYCIVCFAEPHVWSELRGIHIALLFQRQDTFSCKLSLVGMHEVPQILKCSVIGQASVTLFLDDHDVFCHEHDLLLVGMHKFSQEVVHCTKHNDV